MGVVSSGFAFMILLITMTYSTSFHSHEEALTPLPVSSAFTSHGTQTCANFTARVQVKDYITATRHADSDLPREARVLTEQALVEQGLPLSLSSTCTFLIPIAVVQYALRNTISGKYNSKYKPLRDGQMYYLEALLLQQLDQRKKGMKISRAISSGHFLPTLASILTRTVPVLQSTDAATDNLLAYLGIIHYTISSSGHLYLCGMPRHQQTNSELDENISDPEIFSEASCELEKKAVYHQGLVDSNFDAVLKHFVLDHWTGMFLSNRTGSTAIPVKNRMLNIRVSGNGKTSNAGDLFGPVVARHILDRRGQTDVLVRITKERTPGTHIACVGSIVQQFMGVPNLIHWGTGLIKDMDVAPLSKEKSVMHSVRGPRTRDLLLKQHGLNPLVIGDPALMAGEIFSEILAKSTKSIGVCFVIHNVDVAVVKDLCPFCMERRVNNYNRNVTQVFVDLSPCKRVVSSSLHGIIFAHAAGIPALPIVLGNRIIGGDFKFRDHFHSLGLTFFQARLPALSLMSSNTTERQWIDLVDAAKQPALPVRRAHFYDTFPDVHVK